MICTIFLTVETCKDNGFLHDHIPAQVPKGAVMLRLQMNPFTAHFTRPIVPDNSIYELRMHGLSIRQQRFSTWPVQRQHPNIPNELKCDKSVQKAAKSKEACAAGDKVRAANTQPQG